MEAPAEPKPEAKEPEEQQHLGLEPLMCKVKHCSTIYSPLFSLPILFPRRF